MPLMGLSSRDGPGEIVILMEALGEETGELVVFVSATSGKAAFACPTHRNATSVSIPCPLKLAVSLDDSFFGKFQKCINLLAYF